MKCKHSSCFDNFLYAQYFQLNYSLCICAVCAFSCMVTCFCCCCWRRSRHDILCLNASLLCRVCALDDEMLLHLLKYKKKIYIYSQSTQITNEKQPFRASIRVLSRAADDDHKLYVPADIYHSGYDRCQPAHSQYEYVLQLQNHHHSVCSTFRLLSAQIEDAENEKNINKSTMALRASSNWLEAADNAQARRKCLWPFFASISSSHSALSTAKWNSWCFH